MFIQVEGNYLKIIKNCAYYLNKLYLKTNFKKFYYM